MEEVRGGVISILWSQVNSWRLTWILKHTELHLAAVLTYSNLLSCDLSNQGHLIGRVWCYASLHFHVNLYLSMFVHVFMGSCQEFMFKISLPHKLNRWMGSRCFFLCQWRVTGLCWAWFQHQCGERSQSATVSYYRACTIYFSASFNGLNTIDFGVPVFCLSSVNLYLWIHTSQRLDFCSSKNSLL